MNNMIQGFLPGRILLVAPYHHLFFTQFPPDRKLAALSNAVLANPKSQSTAWKLAISAAVNRSFSFRSRCAVHTY
jgi:hypothetical protein